MDFHYVLGKPFVPNESAKTFSKSCWNHKWKLLVIFQNSILLENTLYSKNDGPMLNIFLLFIYLNELLSYTTTGFRHQIKTQLFKNLFQSLRKSNIPTTEIYPSNPWNELLHWNLVVSTKSPCYTLALHG